MNNDQLVSIQYTKLLWKYRSILFRNILAIAILTAIISLIMPKTFKSTAVLMPPKSQSDKSVLNNIEGIPFGDMLSMPTDEISNSIFAILKSRTMMESIIKEMNLVDRYKSDNTEEAIEKLEKNLDYKLLEEGTISVSSLVQTPCLSNEQNDNNSRYMAKEIVSYIISELDRVNKSLQTDEARFHRVFMEKRYNESIINLYNSEEILKIFQEENNTLNLAEQTKAAIRFGAEIRSQILVDKVKLGMLEKDFNPKHPEIERQKQEIKELERQYSALDNSSDSISRQSSDLFPQFSEVPNLEIKLMRLKREVEIQTKLYAFLTQQYEESKIQEARDTPTIQVLDGANYPIKRYKPIRTLMVIGYSLIMFVLSAIYVLLIESDKNSTKQQV